MRFFPCFRGWGRWFESPYLHPFWAGIMRKFQSMLTRRPDSLTRIRPYPVKLDLSSAPTRGRGPQVTAQNSTRHLRLAHSRNDLPPSWDGAPVEWSAWTSNRTTLSFHAPAEALACDQCGAVDEPLICWGKRPPETPTFASTRTKMTKSGRKYEVAHEVKAWAVLDLIAHRCRHCGKDEVRDLRTDERWDLEESDYGAAGSYAGRLF